MPSQPTRCGVVISAQEKMRVRDTGPHSCAPRIKWTKTHHMCESLDRGFRFAQPEFHPTTKRPRLGQIGIE